MRGSKLASGGDLLGFVNFQVPSIPKATECGKNIISEVVSSGTMLLDSG